MLSPQLETSTTGWWHAYPSEKYEFVSWHDEIPNIWKKKHVPNHQPDYYILESTVDVIHCMRSRSVAKLRFGKCHFLDPSTLSQEHIPHHPTNPGPALFLEIAHLYKRRGRRGHRSKPAGTWSSSGIFHSGSGAPSPPKKPENSWWNGEFLRRLRRERSIKKPTLLVANVHSHVLWFLHVHSMHILWQPAGINFCWVITTQK